MRKLKIFFLAALAIGIISIGGCSKSNNNNNSGTSSKDSVIYSKWIVLQMGYAGIDQFSGDSAFEQVLSTPSLTASIVDRGVILTYMAQGTTSTGDTVISSADAILNPFMYVGKIDLYSIGDYSGTPFRYVIIPGSVLASSFPGYTQQQLRAIPYSELTTKLKAAGKSANTVQLNSPQ